MGARHLESLATLTKSQAFDPIDSLNSEFQKITNIQSFPPPSFYPVAGGGRVGSSPSQPNMMPINPIGDVDDDFEIDLASTIARYHKFAVTKTGGGTLTITMKNMLKERSILFHFDVEIDSASAPTLAFSPTIANLPTLPTANGSRYVLTVIGHRDSTEERYEVVNAEFFGSGSGLSEPIIHSIANYGSSGTPATTNQALDLSATTGNAHKVYLGGDFDISFTNPPAIDKLEPFEIVLIQDGTGNRTPTFTSGIIIGNTDVDQTPGSVTIKVVQTFDQGTTYYMYDATGGTGGGGTASPLTTKGDIWGYDTGNARVPIGSNNQYFIADSAQSLGLKWAGLDISHDTTPTLGGDLLAGGWHIFLNGSKLNIDADADSFLQATSDDVVKMTVGTINTVDFLVDSLFFQGGINLDMNGNDIILDNDGDTKINVNGDDDVRLEVGGNTIALMALSEFIINLNLDFNANGSATTTSHSIWGEAGGLFMNAIDGTQYQLRIDGEPVLTIEEELVTITNTGENAATLVLYGNDTTPTDAKAYSRLIFEANNDTPAEHQFAVIEMIARDVSAGLEDGELKFGIHVNGSNVDIFQLIATKMDMLADLDMNDNDIDFSTYSHSIEADTDILRMDLSSLTSEFVVHFGGNELVIFDAISAYGSSSPAYTFTSTGSEDTEPFLQIWFPDASPQDNNSVGHLQWLFNDPAWVAGEIEVIATDVTSTTEDSAMKLKIMQAGSQITMFEVASSAAGVKQMAFFGLTPVAQQTSTNSTPTAGATYTSAEQDMLNDLWNMVVAYGLLDES